MTPEERFERMERQMEFLGQNQADLQQELLALARIVQRHVVSTEARFQTVAERFQMVADQFQRVDESMESLAAAQRTEERLNALIIIVERYFSNGKH